MLRIGIILIFKKGLNIEKEALILENVTAIEK